RQSQHRGERKSRTAPQPAQSVADILDKGIEHRQPPPFAIRFFRCLDAAQPDQRLPPRFPGAHSGTQIVVDVHLEIALDLLDQFAVVAIPAEQSGEAANENGQMSHTEGSLRRDRNLAMTAAVSCQSLASVSSCL